MSARRDEPSVERAVEPVREIPGEARPEPEEGIALCLSGGGYRAMPFHLGALWRLNELGYLPRLARVSSVSGGSITAGVLAKNWAQLDFDGTGVAQALCQPIRELAERTINFWVILLGILLPGSIGDRYVGAFKRHPSAVPPSRRCPTTQSS
jgi:NTE family protein